jgi:hypothetical protein
MDEAAMAAQGQKNTALGFHNHSFIPSAMEGPVVVGLGRIVALHHRSSTSYQICQDIRWLHF